MLGVKTGVENVSFGVWKKGEVSENRAAQYEFQRKTPKGESLRKKLLVATHVDSSSPTFGSLYVFRS